MRSDRLTWFRQWASCALAAAVLLVGSAGCASGGRFQNLNGTGLHALGQQDFDEGRYTDAIEALDRLMLVFPDYPQIAEARFLLARAYQEDEQYLLASDEYLRFLERHNGHLLAPDAAVGVCRSYVSLSPIPQRDQTYTRQAFNVCRDVATQYGTNAVAAEATEAAVQMRAKLAEKMYQTGEHYYSRSANDSAIQTWELLLDEFGDTVWAPRALKGITCAWQKIGYQDDVEETRLRLLNSYPDSDEARQAQGGGLSC